MALLKRPASSERSQKMDPPSTAITQTCGSPVEVLREAFGVLVEVEAGAVGAEEHGTDRSDRRAAVRIDRRDGQWTGASGPVDDLADQILLTYEFLGHRDHALFNGVIAAICSAARSSAISRS